MKTTNKHKSKGKEDIFEKIIEWQKNPEFIRAAHEFIKNHTGS